MSDLTLTIPAEVVATMRIPPRRREEELRKELAIQLYREGIVAGAGACRICGLSKLEFQDLLGRRGVCQQYDVDDYKQDLEDLAEWTSSQ